MPVMKVGEMRMEMAHRQMHVGMLGRHDAMNYSRRLLEQFTKGFTA